MIMIIDEVGEFEDSNKEANEICEPEKAAEVIKWYKDIIKMKKKELQALHIIKERFLKDLKKRKSLLNLSVN